MHFLKFAVELNNILVFAIYQGFFFNLNQLLRHFIVNFILN